MARHGKDSNIPSAARLLEDVLRTQAGAFDKSLGALTSDYDPERLHKARVALRRLRSALQGFAPILDKDEARKLSRQARDLFRILGPLREADVAVESFATEADRELLAARALALRGETRDRLQAAGVDAFAARVESGLRDGRLLGKGPPARRLALSSAPLLGALALQEVWTRVLAYGDSIAALQEEPRHDFRKDMKTLRYLTEFFLPVMAGRKPAKFIKRLEKLQEDLGELNDIAVHTRGGSLEGDLQRRADRATRAAETHWAKLRKAGPWWG